MDFNDKKIDVIKNIKKIENLKSEILVNVSNLFKTLVEDEKQDVLETAVNELSNIIILCHLLGRNLGIEYNDIYGKIKKEVRLKLINKYSIDENHEDLLEFMSYIRGVSDE